MYFDLHHHVAFKSFLTETRPERRDDCWTIYRNFIDFLVGNIIDSQCSLGQLDRGGARLSVVAIYTLEDGLDEVFLLRSVLPLITHLDRRMIRNIDPERYWARFLEKVAHLEGSLENTDHPAARFRIASAAADIDPDRNTLVLSVEGGHILEAATEEATMERLDALKNFRHKILYLTLNHFARNPFCTQAYSLKLVNARKAPTFLPGGTGLTGLGRRVIERAYSETGGRRMLLDVKHLSLSGRRDFYALRRSNPATRELPIIASHVAVTGLSWSYESRRAHTREMVRLDALSQYAVTYDRPPGIALGRLRTAFNPASINLYDEDIREIVGSGGLIGLMMDQRQLGVNKKVFEYFGIADYDNLSVAEDASRVVPVAEELPAGKERAYVRKLHRRGLRQVASFVNPVSGPSFRSLKEMVTGPPTPPPPEERRRSGWSDHTPRRLNRKRKLHLLHLINNLLHVVEVGGPAAWDCLCIGSDFDGLVDAPNNCENATDFPDLEVHLNEVMGELLEREGAAFAARYHVTDLRSQLRGVLEDNGRRFLREWL